MALSGAPEYLSIINADQCIGAKMYMYVMGFAQNLCPCDHLQQDGYD